jgi:hypothetical protein
MGVVVRFVCGQESKYGQSPRANEDPCVSSPAAVNELGRSGLSAVSPEMGNSSYHLTPLRLSNIVLEYAAV